MAQIIEHSGIVERVEQDEVVVKILSKSACGSCAARQACGMSESQEKIVSVRTENAQDYAVGDEVKVGVYRNAASRAVLIAYVGGLVVLVGILALCSMIEGVSDGMSALSAIAGVALYYVAIWLLRKKIDKTIHFTITK